MKILITFQIIVACILASNLALADNALEQHRMLQLDEGEWSAKIQFIQDNEVRSTFNWHEKNVMVGQLWSVGRLYGDLNGTLYEGFAMLGFDPKQDAYVGTWVDSMSPEILQMKGSFDVSSNTLTLEYDVTTDAGERQQRKNIMIYKNNNHRDFTMYIFQNAKWVKSMTIDYRRIK